LPSGWATHALSLNDVTPIDRGAAAGRAVQDAADALRPRLDGTPVVPSFPTPLEKELRTA